MKRLLLISITLLLASCQEQTMFSKGICNKSNLINDRITDLFLGSYITDAGDKVNLNKVHQGYEFLLKQGDVKTNFKASFCHLGDRILIETKVNLLKTTIGRMFSKDRVIYQYFYLGEFFTDLNSDDIIDQYVTEVKQEGIDELHLGVVSNTNNASLAELKIKTTTITSPFHPNLELNIVKNTKATNEQILKKLSKSSEDFPIIEFTKINNHK